MATCMYKYKGEEFPSLKAVRSFIEKELREQIQQQGPGPSVEKSAVRRFDL